MCAPPALRDARGLRRKEGVLLFWLPSTYETARAQNLRPRSLNVLGYSIPLRPGLVYRRLECDANVRVRWNPD